MVSDPFAILGIEPRFDVDIPSLEGRHRDLSRALHPDRYVGRPSAERRLALSKAIEVNEALRILKDPVRRAQALLERRSLALEEGQEPKPAPDFLMNVLEDREELASAHACRDLAKVEALAASAAAREGELRLELSSAFTVLDIRPLASAAQSVGQIAQKMGELRYYRRFMEEVRAILDDLA